MDVAPEKSSDLTYKHFWEIILSNKVEEFKDYTVYSMTISNYSEKYMKKSNHWES